MQQGQSSMCRVCGADMRRVAALCIRAPVLHMLSSRDLRYWAG